MCYSLMVEMDIRRLMKEYDAAVDATGYLELLERRANGDKTFKLPRATDAYFAHDPSGPGKRCHALAAEFAEAEAARLRAKADEQRGKIASLAAALAKKATKTNEGKLATAQRVLAKAEADAKRVLGPVTAVDTLIHPFTYAPLIVREGRSNVVKFYRYQVRPRWSAQEPNRELNLFNARLDGLNERRTWAPLYGTSHAALLFKSFFEWVPAPETGKTTIINFMPTSGQTLWAPALHDRWEPQVGDGKAIESFAIITTDPPPEVEFMGHDRCPVVPKTGFMQDWLNPGSCSKAHLDAGLRDPEPVTFAYKWGVPEESASFDR